MAQELNKLAAHLLETAQQAGAETADVLVTQGQSMSIDIRNGQLEKAERAEGIDLGLRVFVGTRSAIVSTSDTRPETMAIMAERAIAMAREAPEDPYAGLAAADQIAGDFDIDALELFDATPEPSASDLEEDARRAEAAAAAVDGITQIESATAGYSQSEVFLAASNGFSGGYRRSSRGRSCVAITGSGTGMERDYDGDSRTFQADLRSAEEIGQTAAERALARANARKPKTGQFPVLFDERISASLIGHLLAAANGAAIARGGSWLQEALGEQVLPPELSVIEDPHRPRIAGSRPFDAEGFATRKRLIVDQGVLTGWTLDLSSARKLGMQTTGNATRGVSSAPSPSNWNIALTPGAASREDLIRDMGTGLLVTSLIGTTINPTTGDYSRGASGLWVENGEVLYPVNEFTIAGNLRDMLRRIIPANDARRYLSREVPSLLIEGMTVAGA